MMHVDWEVSWRLSGRGKGQVRTYLRHLPMSVHPFIVGQSAVERSLTEQETIRLGTLVGQVHRSGATLPWRDGPTERFEIECVDTLDRLLTTRSAATHTLNSYQCRVVELLSQNRQSVRNATERLQQLQSIARFAGSRHVITHGDLTASNVMIDTDGRLHLIDWNGAGLAPPERDLVFFSGPNFASFLDGYVQAYALDGLSADLLSFFIYRWRLDGIAFFSDRICCQPTPHSRTKEDCDMLQSFLPFNEEDIAITVSAMEKVIRERLAAHEATKERKAAQEGAKKE